MKTKTKNKLKAIPMIMLITFLGSCEPVESVQPHIGDFIWIGIAIVLGIVALLCTKKIDWSVYNFSNDGINDLDLQ